MIPCLAAAVLTAAVLTWLHARAAERLARLHAQQLESLQAFQREDKQRWEQQQADLLDRFNAEREAWERERGALLNRIKPETAQYVPGDEPEPASVPLFDNDEEWWAQRESREELADRLMEEELSGRHG